MIGMIRIEFVYLILMLGMWEYWIIGLILVKIWFNVLEFLYFFLMMGICGHWMIGYKWITYKNSIITRCFLIFVVFVVENFRSIE
jgi:hypothetical protein